MTSFKYVSPGDITERVFMVPPLDTTKLISTPEMTGVSDLVNLHTATYNKRRCSEFQPDIMVPQVFDYRQEYWQFLSPIIDQGTCGACWAISSTQSLASRFALFSNQVVIPLSATYMVYCLRASFQGHPTYGCNGGNLVEAFWFCAVDGVVSEKCAPYTLSEWFTSSGQVTNQMVGKQHVKCPARVCMNPKDKPLVFRTSTQYIVAGTPHQSGGSEGNIRKDVWINGPASTGFEVREDFMTYWKHLLEGKLKMEATIYDPLPISASNTVMGNHAVQIVGWGEIGIKKFWIVANSWGATNTGNTPADLNDYGYNGYFLMVRGTNACAFESNVVAGIPLLQRGVLAVDGTPNTNAERSLCHILGYDVNAQTIEELSLPQLALLPNTVNSTAFSNDLLYTPDQIGENGTIRRFAVCPPYLPHRCLYKGNCVTNIEECEPV